VKDRQTLTPFERPIALEEEAMFTEEEQNGKPHHRVT
jgi:hypothetical protein